ncbi:MAG: lysophospholipase [Lachnospiraceae bacterium]|nr:lysophospholipase [Lachnospiraceae bacterium]
MYIYDDKIKLHASLDMPKNGAEKCPLCIIIHGFTGYSTERHIVAVQEAMNEIGIATLRVDMYGHGKSDGKFRDHTLHKWISNAMAVFDYVKTLDFVTEVYLCGHSQGGLLSMLVAPMEKETVKILIPMSPAIIIPRGSRMGNQLGIVFDPDNIPEEIHTDEWTLGGNYIRVAQTIDVDRAIEAFKGKTLIIHGDEDEVVPYEDSVDAAGKYADCELVTIPGDNHGYESHLDLVCDAIKEYLIRNAKGLK